MLMPTHRIYISGKNDKNLTKEESMSGLINRLLGIHYRKKKNNDTAKAIVEQMIVDADSNSPETNEFKRGYKEGLVQVLSRLQ